MDNKLLETSLFFGYDSIPGITRKKIKNDFAYFDANGIKITDQKILIRIESLIIPPSYEQVWISPFENSHLQATARDTKGKKQYFYHPQWRLIREETKFHQMVPFGKMLPKIRRTVKKEINKPLKINKTQVICAIIYLLDNYFIRIGNSISEKQNQSYGLTTLRKKHLILKTSNQAILSFKGKSATPWHIVLKEKRLIQILKKCEAIPGYRLFKYRDEQKNYIEITSHDVNNYLKNLTDFSFTAKDFRTWGACREALYRFCKVNYNAEDKSQLKNIISEVSQILGHTPSICKKCYIYPEIITHWQQHSIQNWLTQNQMTKNKDKLLLQWLEAHTK